MKILVLNGSPLKNGKTKQICDAVLAGLDADIKTYYAYETNIRPCIACEYCFTHENECIIKDELQTLVKDIEVSDVIIIASPIHFSSMSGQLLSMLSRFQYLYALKYVHHKEAPFKAKKGLTIIDGGNNYPTMFEASKNVDQMIYDHLNVTEYQRLLINDTDKYTSEELVSRYQDEINEIREKLHKKNFE